MHTKLLLSSIAIVAVGGISYWLIAPAYRVVEKQDASPIAQSPKPQPSVPAVKDALETMDAPTKAKMNAQIEVMKEKPILKEMQTPTALIAKVIAQGQLVARAHEVKGKVLLIEDQEKQILRFEDFETINGPDLRIYLSSTLGIEDSIDLGAIQGTKGNVNYSLPGTIDISKYRYVLVWCRAFRVLFSYTELR